MKKVYFYKYNKNILGTKLTAYDYIIIEKKGFGDTKIIKDGTTLKNTFSDTIGNIENTYSFTRRKDYQETLKIIKSLATKKER